MGTSDGEIFAVNAENAWAQLGPRRNVEIIALASTESALYVLDADGAVFRSEDGRNFAQIKQPPPTPTNLARLPGLGRPFRALSARRVGATDVVLIAGVSRHVAHTRDGGKTWVDDALDGPETLRGGHIDPDGTVYVTGERGRTFSRAPSDAVWGELHMKDKPTAVWIGRSDSGLLTTDAGGSVRVFDGEEWSPAGRAPGPLRAFVTVGKKVFAACQAGGVVQLGSFGKDTQHPRVWSGDGRPLTRIVASGKSLWALGPELLVRQSGRTWTRVRGARTQSLSAVAVLGQKRGFAVGRAGTLLQRSETSKGSRWDPIALDRDAALMDIEFAGGRFGWVAAADGSVGRTDDGAKSWKFAEPGPNAGLLSLAALDPLNVFASGRGGALFASGDRGVNWRKVDVLVPAKVPNITGLALERADKDARLLAATDKGLLLETDVGRSEVSASGFGFVNPSRVTSAGGTSWILDLTGMILRRGKSQKEWQVVAIPMGMALTDLEILGGRLGVALTNSGSVLRTSDGGATWWLVAGGPSRAPAAVTGVDGHFIVVGHGGEIQRSPDGGASWLGVKSGIGKSLTAASAVDDLVVAVGFRGAAVATADRGQSWTPWLGAPPDAGSTHLTALSEDGGRLALGGIGALWVRDGTDKPWVRLEVEGKLGEVRRIRWGTGTKLVAVTATGGLWRRDGNQLKALSVAPPPKVETVRWRDLAQADGRTIAVTQEGVVHVDPDAAKPGWERARLPLGIGAEPVGVAPVGDRTWLLGSGGFWVHDQGAWKQVVPALPSRPIDIHFSTPEVGYAVGGGGVIYRTADSGSTWVAEATPTRTGLGGVHVGPDGAAYAVGQGGLILRRVGR